MGAIHTKPDVDAVPVASIKKHLKNLYSTREYLQTYCRWNYYNPHPETQLVFHNSHADERSIVLGTQQGKTTAAGFEMAFAVVDWWPTWHNGRHPSPPQIERSAKFIGWYCSVSSQNVRDGAQNKLLGDISQKDGLGTGAIPLDYIEGITMSRGNFQFCRYHHSAERNWRYWDFAKQDLRAERFELPRRARRFAMGGRRPRRR